jgi:hypothetical protein
MATYTVGSPEYAAACERAEEQIRDELKAGAVEQYIDGESAQQYLGELIRLNNQRREIGETISDWMRRVDGDINRYLNQIMDRAVESNVARVVQENAE